MYNCAVKNNSNKHMEKETITKSQKTLLFGVGIMMMFFGLMLGYIFGLQSIPKKLTIAKFQELMDDIDIKSRAVEALVTDGDGRKLIGNKMMAYFSANGMLKDVVIKKNGKVLLLRDGKLEELKESLPTTNKGAIDKEGRVVDPDGTYRSLEEEQMVTIDGKIIKKL